MKRPRKKRETARRHYSSGRKNLDPSSQTEAQARMLLSVPPRSCKYSTISFGRHIRSRPTAFSWKSNSSDGILPTHWGFFQSHRRKLQRAKFVLYDGGVSTFSPENHDVTQGSAIAASRGETTTALELSRP